MNVCVLFKCPNDKQKLCVCVGGGDDKPASSVVVYRTFSALEAWSWNAVSHETEGTTTAPAEVVVD